MTRQYGHTRLFIAVTNRNMFETKFAKCALIPYVVEGPGQPVSSQSDQGFHCLVTSSVDTGECNDRHSPDQTAHMHKKTSRKHAYIILIPLNPTFIQ